MRILMVCQHLPWPLNAGHRQRSHAILKTLARRHEVTLATVVESPEQVEALKGLVTDVLPLPGDLKQRLTPPMGRGRLRRLKETFADLAQNPVPYSQRLADPAIADVFKPHVDQFDMVLCRFVAMMPLLDAFPLGKVVLDIDDVTYVGMGRSIFEGIHGWGVPLVAAETLRLYRYTQQLSRDVARLLLVSDRDMARFPDARKTLVRNGINLPDPAILKPEPRPSSLVYVGSAGYGLNTDGLRWFITQVWPIVRAAMPEATLTIAGRNADAETLPFALVEGVKLVGEVSDPAAWFSDATLSITPLINGMGTRIKILESLACGRPVVATVVGAEGHDKLGEEQGLFRARNHDEMAAQILALLRDPERATRVGKRGRALVEAESTWDATTAILDSDLESWIKPEQAGAVASASAVGSSGGRR